MLFIKIAPGSDFKWSFKSLLGDKVKRPPPEWLERPSEIICRRVYFSLHLTRRESQKYNKMNYKVKLRKRKRKGSVWKPGRLYVIRVKTKRPRKRSILSTRSHWAATYFFFCIIRAKNRRKRRPAAAHQRDVTTPSLLNRTNTRRLSISRGAKAHNADMYIRPYRYLCLTILFSFSPEKQCHAASAWRLKLNPDIELARTLLLLFIHCPEIFFFNSTNSPAKSNTMIFN